MVQVLHDAILLNDDCVSRKEGKHQSRREMEDMKGIYQIVVSKNGFASLDQRQPISINHR